jgi:organic hydroperoxide reductase OsmC/OhrA
MAKYTATVTWERKGETFTDNRYSRGHLWHFDGGAVVPASSSPHVVRVPFSDPAGVDPEEALVASLSSCHMLSFLYLAAKQGFVVDRYADEAEGVMGKNAENKLALLSVTLHPKVTCSGSRIPTEDDLHSLHHQAHEECFIANSVKTEVRCEPLA